MYQIFSENAISGKALILQGQWRDILSREFFGSVAFICLPALFWTVPYYRVVGWDHTYEIWFGQVEQRLVTTGLFKHVVYFPFATIVAMLPWSLFVLSYARLSLRERPEIRQLITYLVLCLAITFLSLWFIPDAKPRYYLPLYPLAAVLVAIPFTMTPRQNSKQHAAARQACIRIIQLLSLVIGMALVVTAILTLFMPQSWRVAQVLPPLWAAFVMLLISVLNAISSRFAFHRASRFRVSMAVILFGLLIGLGHRLIILPVQRNLSYSPEAAIRSLVATLPEPEKLVSLGPIPSRFRYFYPHFIPIIQPEKAKEALDTTVSHFCIAGEWFRKQTPDLARKRQSQDFQALAFQNGVVLCHRLDIRWKPVAIVPLGRTPTRDPQSVVIVGCPTDKCR